MAAVSWEHLLEGGHGLIQISEDAEEGGFGGQDVVDDGGGLAGAVAEGQAVFIEGEWLFEVVELELLSSLDGERSTLSSFCLSTLISLNFSKTIKQSKNNGCHRFRSNNHQLPTIPQPQPLF